MKHVGKILGGIALILIGIVGLIMPIMPGWVFIIPGMALLADYFPPFRRLLEWGRRKLEEETGPHLRKWKQSREQTGPEPPAA